MSLARAFTLRHKEAAPSNLHIGRAASQRNGRAIQRSQISGPVALISSTNAQSYEAPDIINTNRPARFRNVSSSSNSSNADDSDASTMDLGNTTDASSIDGGCSPITSEPEPNHLSCYFKPSVDTKSPTRSPSTSTRGSFDAPVIPQRQLSHSKKAHEFLHRKRSVQRMMSPPASMLRRESSEMFGQSTYASPAEASKENPFGNELAQLDEVAEDLSHAVRDAETDEDLFYMKSRGLATFEANDYLSEIQDLIYDTFVAEVPVWI